MAAPYHFGRPDIAGNTGTDEANHFIEMAGIFMRPGYLMPVFDLEAGTSANALATFSIDFSNRIYQVLGIRPGMYINGNHTSHLVGSATPAQLATIAQPQSQSPSVVGPAYPMLWNARYSDQASPETIPIQTGEPKHTYTTVNSYYGPWDDYGNPEPWNFWQFSSTTNVPGFNTVDTGIDSNVAHGDIEYVRNYLVPAVWMNDSSGDWSTLANWNSGRAVTVPQQGPGQAPAFSYDAAALPSPRLPGANSGIGATHGQYDTVILERPGANITVTHSTGGTNIRKLYMREALDITGGALTVNYNPLYRADNSNEVLHGGSISAQFSGPVSLSGTGSFSAHTVQVDSGQTFTLGGGTLAFNKINLISNSLTKIAVTGDFAINPLNNASATITRSASTGSVDLTGGVRRLTVGNGAADEDLVVAVPMINGGFIKAGAGTMRLNGDSAITGDVSVIGGTLRYGHSSGLGNNSLVTVDNTGRLEMNGFSDTIAGLTSTAGHTTGLVLQGSANLTIDSPSGTNTYAGTINGTGSLTKNGAGTQILSGANTLGPINMNSGSLFLNGNSSTGTVTVNGGTFGGSGTASGSVIVNNTGHLATGATPQTFDAGALTLNAGSVLDIKLGAFGAADRINVAGQLDLGGGSINIIDFNGIEPGLYTIIDYGTRVGSVLNLGTPTGPAGFSYELIDNGSFIRVAVSELPAGIPGDFNDDGFVNSQDHVVWKKFNGLDIDLPNDNDLSGPIGAAEYELWQVHFGRYEGDGHSPGVVPEPAAAALLALGVIGFAARRRRR
jgi:autotransporter-associated beta strand protein